MAILSKELIWRAKCWLERMFGRIYTTQVKEDIPCDFRSHVFVMRVTGLWPTADDSSQYKWLTIASFLCVCVLTPASVVVNIFFAHSIEQAMDHLFISSSGLPTAVRAGVLYWHRHSIRNIFRIHAGLTRNTSSEHTAYNDRLARMNFHIHMILTALYSAVMLAISVQIIFMVPQGRILSSTAYLPYAFAQHRSLYLAVLTYQVCSSWVNIMTASTQDAVFVAMINTVCGHVKQLKERLQQLNANGDDATFYKDLIDCCQRYADCLR